MMWPGVNVTSFGSKILEIENFITGHSMLNQRMKFLQIWCGEGVYGLTQPHQI